MSNPPTSPKLVASAPAATDIQNDALLRNSSFENESLEEKATLKKAALEKLV
jgi:hypothetical protein